MSSTRANIGVFQATFQPAFYLCLAFAGGILMERTFYLQPATLIASLLAATAAAGFCCWRRWAQRTNVAILLGFAITGGLLLALETDHSAPARIIRAVERGAIAPEEPIELYGELCAPACPAPRRVYLELDTHLIRSEKRATSASGRVRITLWLYDEVARADYKRLALRPGDWLRVEALPQPQERFKNPGTPDLQQWLEQQGYDMAVSVKSPLMIEVLDRSQNRLLPDLLDRAQEYLFERIDTQFSPRPAGVIKASILGNGHYLDREIGEDFRTGGTYHILVISGSHIALLGIIANWILGLIVRHRWVRFALVAAMLWAYGALVGAQAPVMRAVVMTTLGMAAMALGRRVRPANTLGLAGLALLAYHPSSLFEAGFQLTFTAVCLILLVALPLAGQLAAVGGWQPTARTPYPPQCPAMVRWLAELLFWRQGKFEREMSDSLIKYRLEKTAWAGRLERSFLQRPFRAIVVITLTSAIVQLGLLPLSASYFNRIALIGILLNVAADLLMTVLLAGFLLFAAVDACSSGAGHQVARLVEAISNLFVASASPVHAFRVFSFRVANYTDWHACIYALYFLPVLIFLICVNRWQPLAKPSARPSQRSNRHRFILIGVSLIYALLLFAVMAPQLFGTGARAVSSNRLEVVFLDVGQGDAALIRFPGGTTMMVDSGGSIQFGSTKINGEDAIVEDLPTIGEQVVSKYLWWRGIERLDYIVATHAHSDHIEGLGDLLKNFSTGCAVVPAIPNADAEFDRFARQARAAGVPLVVWRSGKSFVIDGVKIEVFWPPEHEPVPAQLGNNQSLVLRLSYGRRRIFMAGDIERQPEQELVASGIDLASDVLKAPHHGSKTSSSIDFLQRVAPEVAIISAPNRSRFNHPHREVLERYCRLGIHIYQTGLAGAITISTDGQDLRVEPFAGQERACP